MADGSGVVEVEMPVAPKEVVQSEASKKIDRLMSEARAKQAAEFPDKVGNFIAKARVDQNSSDEKNTVDSPVVGAVPPELANATPSGGTSTEQSLTVAERSANISNLISAAKAGEKAAKEITDLGVDISPNSTVDSLMETLTTEKGWQNNEATRDYAQSAIDSEKRKHFSGVETNTRNGADRFFDSLGIKDKMAQAYEKVTGKAPSKEQIDRLAKNVRDKVAKVKVLGQPLPDFIAGAVTGAASKQLASMGLAIAGIGGLPFTAGAGAVAGGATGAIREYLKQRHTIDIGDTSETKGQRQKLKNEFVRLKAADRTKLRNAALRGAVTGAVGGVVGGFIVDHVDWSSIGSHLPGLGNETPDVIIARADGAPLPTMEGVVTDAPVSGSGEAIVPAQPIPTEIPGVSGGEVVAQAPGAGEAAEAVAPVSPAPAEVPTEVGEVKPRLPMDIPPEDLVKPAVPEIELPAGSNPWTEVDKYLTDELGRPPTNAEISESVARLLSDNEIVDATKIPAGTHLSMDGVNQHIGEILGSRPPLSADLAVLPQSLPLPVGSNPWNEVSLLLEDELNRPPTNLEILDVTRELCRQSNIAVPEWGVNGALDYKNLPAGFMLNFDDEVKRKIAEIAA